MQPSVITLEAISKRYGDFMAVDNATFDVGSGEIVSLLGPSGCGKTTTLRLIAGIEQPDEGNIYLNEMQVAGKRSWVPPEQRRVGMVFQDYALFPHLSVSANIAFGLRKQRGPAVEDRVRAMLKLVGLRGAEARMPHELSGGQQQRVALARALAPQPDVLLLDEPFSNLDAALRYHMRSEVKAILRETGITTVFVTHDQEEALSIADQVVVMFGGKIAQMGTPQTVYRHPADEHIAAFVGEANIIDAEAHGETADCLFGTVTLAQPAHGPVRLMFRPESLVLADEDQAGTPVHVDDVEFYGYSQHIQAHASDGTPLILRTVPLPPLHPGQTVAVTVVGAVHVLAGV